MMNVRDSVLDDTKKLFSYLLLTCKNVFLYPEGHSISVQSIRQFHDALDTYIRQYGEFKIEIERDRVMSQGLEVHKGPYEEGSLPFTLFRDGIRWLEFTEGIKLEETREVLSIIHRYSVLTAEPEGDIVTAFWEAHFDHVSYKADDFVSEQSSEQMESLSESDQDAAGAETQEDIETPTEVEPEESLGSTISATPLGGLAIDPSLFILTSEEKVELQEMVAREEKASAREHLNMLLDMLLQCHEEKDLSVVIGVLSEEFEGSFSSNDFETTVTILDGIRKVLDSGRQLATWAEPLIASSYKDISSDAKCLKPLEKIWSHLNAQQIETVQGILQHLKASAVPTLAHLLLLGQPSKLEKIVEDRIFIFATQDITCLDTLINDPEEKIAEKTVSILSRIKDDSALKYIMKIARHPSASIRRMAIKAMGQSSGNQIPAIFEFIKDPDFTVRKAVLAQLNQSRNETAENLLLQYLQNQKFDTTENEHIVECFRTLGKCGSLRSLPFLHKTLLHRTWLAFFKKSPYRQGAAHALVALKLPEAQQIIERAGRSIAPGLRGLVREAEKEFLKNKGVR